jgi:hypothetical protein
MQKIMIRIGNVAKLPTPPASCNPISFLKGSNEHCALEEGEIMMETE